MSLFITNPAANGDPFPATITGTYDTGGGGGGTPGACAIPIGLSVTVTVTKTSNPGYSNVQNAALVCTTNSAGTWSCPKPTDLVAGQNDYKIAATSSAGNDSKSNITT